MSLLETLLVGKTLASRYTIHDPLGRGGMGAVFRSYDERLRRWVALKMVATGDLDVEQEERGRRRFEREARLAAGLNHPNVVTVHDFGIDDAFGVQYLVMELLSGINLKACLASRGPLPTAQALRFVEQAARGVAAGHRAGLIHRDIKPDNLFLTDDGERVVVLDFGIAVESAADQTSTRLTIAEIGPHSPNYAAPEQLRGGPITTATDVFSLAATAFELFTGRRVAPAGGQAGDETAIAAAQRYLDENGDRFPAAVQAALKRSLSVRPADRPADGAAFLEALDPSETAWLPPPPPRKPPAPVDNADKAGKAASPASPPVPSHVPTELFYSEESFRRIIRRSLGKAPLPARLNATPTEHGYSREEIRRVGRELGINPDQLRLAMSEEEVRSPLPEIQSAFGDDGCCSQWIVPLPQAAVEPALLRWMLRNRDFAVLRRSSDAIGWKRTEKQWPEGNTYRPTANGLHHVRAIVTSVYAVGAAETLVRLDAEVAIRKAELKEHFKKLGRTTSEEFLERARQPRPEPVWASLALTVASLAVALWISYSRELVSFASLNSWRINLVDLVGSGSFSRWGGHLADLLPLEPVDSLSHGLAVIMAAVAWLLFLRFAIGLRRTRKANDMKREYQAVREAKKRETREAFQEVFQALSQSSEGASAGASGAK